MQIILVNTIKIKRCTIFSHFDKNNLVDDYVFYYLEKLKDVSEDIIFITTSDIPVETVNYLERICKWVIIRENTGYDFMSWKVGIESISELKLYDELIICNDSIFGPFLPLKGIFDKMDMKKCHFWGLTENSTIAYHLQSYFLVFRSPVISSKEFKEFWSSIELLSSKINIIEKYEIGLTQKLLKADFKAEAYIHYHLSLWTFLKRIIMNKSYSNFDISKLIQLVLSVLTFFKYYLKNRHLLRKNLNLTHYAWKELILKKNMPFIKIELLRDNPMRMDISDYEATITKVSNYNLDLIRRHLNRVKKVE